MTGGKAAAYKQVLSLFCKDAEDRMPLLQAVPKSDAMIAFTTQVHALKSASTSLGAAEVSAEAAELETAGKAGDIAFIGNHLPVFTEHLMALIKNIQDVLEPDKSAERDTSGSTLSASHLQMLKELSEALKSEKVSEIKRILKTLDQQAQDSKLKEIIEQISDQVFMTEFDNAVKTVEELIAKRN